MESKVSHLWKRHQETILLAGIFLTILSVNLPFVHEKIYNSDACEYLEAGKNLFTGKGFVTTFNKYQAWRGFSFPWLPHSPPLYSLVAGFILWTMNLEAVVLFNILLWSVNGVLLYKILRFSTEIKVAFLSVLVLGLTFPGTMTAVTPWSEQLHLFFILGALYLYLKDNKKYFISGLILTAGCFVRFAGVFNVLAFCASLWFADRHSEKPFKRPLKVFSAFCFILGTYELFCKLKFGYFYPQYAVFCKTHTWAEILPGGEYQTSGVPLTLPAPQFSTTIRFALINISSHLRVLIQGCGQLQTIICMGILFPFLPFMKKNWNWSVLWTQGFFLLVLYPLSTWWCPKIEAQRYGLIPFLLLGCLGFLVFDQLLRRCLPQKWSGAVFLFLMAVLILEIGADHQSFLKDYRASILQGYMQDRNEVVDWFAKNSSENDLIATEFDQDSCVWGHPMIPVPQGKMQTPKKMDDFINAFHPKFLMVGTRELVGECEGKGFRKLFQNRFFAVFSVEK